MPTDEEIQQAIQDQDMEEGNYLQAPYDFNQSMQIGQYFASQGMPPEIDPEAWNVREEERKKKIDQRAKSGQQGADIAKRKQTPRQQLDIPDFLQSAQMDEIYRRDAEENREFDEAVARGDLKEGVKIRQREAQEPAKMSLLGRLPGEAPPTLAGQNAALAVGKSLVPDLTDPKETAEYFTDLAAHVAFTKNPVTGVASFAGKRAFKTIMKEVIGLTPNYRRLALPSGGSVNEAQMFGSWVDTMIAAKNSIPTNLKMTGSGDGSGLGKIKEFGYAPRPSESEIAAVTRKMLNDNVLVDGKFNYDKFKELYTGNSAMSRKIASYIETPPYAYQQNWEKTRQGLVDIFETIYGDVMQVKGITRKDIHIDHLVTLRSTLPIFDDVAFGSPLWNEIQETILRSKNKYKPGDTLANYNALERGADIVKTNFFNNRLGKDGEKFFTPEIRAYMKKSKANRIEVLKDWIEIQDEGTEILREAQNVWETLYKIEGSTDLPQEIVEKLARIPIHKYSHPELRQPFKQLKRIVKEIIEDEVTRAEEGLTGLSKTIKEGIEVEDWDRSVRQVQQDTPRPPEPKPTRVQSKKNKLIKDITKEPKKKNPDQTELDL